MLAAVLRLWALGHPAVLMFDETYYVKDAWTLLNLGYEGSWPPKADDAFNAGSVDHFTENAQYIAHPPLGKWLIGLGIAVFGPTNPFGWRISVAVAGVLAVLLLTLIATSLFRSTTMGVLTGGLFAIDGQAIVLSRVSLLDNFVLLFALAGFGAMLLDRRALDARLSAWREDRLASGGSFGWGPPLAWRPWLLAAGLAFGLTCAVKWSGLYYLAAFAVYAVVVEALARRRAGVPRWLPATLLRTAPLAFLWMVPVALATYLTSFAGWFLSSRGYDRNWIDRGGERWTGLLAWVPDAIQNLWHWHATIYAFHTGLSATHPYATPAILWPLLGRPTQIYYRGSGTGENGCQYGYCSEIVWEIANPLLWWAAVAATGYLVYRFARYRAARDGLILVAVAAGYLPWLLYPTRTMFQFYSIVFEPYLLLALVAVLGTLTGHLGTSPFPAERLPVVRRFALVFLVLVVLLSAFFYPEWTGMQTPFWFWQLHVWSYSWV
ncbi:MAG: hypothetical protein JWR33_213 [Naasia sp.]|nr:hypothetical protein [Naasia sp.]